MHVFLDPLKGLYSPGGARLRLGDTGVTYPQVSAEMEAFSRPLWALVPFWAGGGQDADFEALYVRGLACGTNPDSAEYWGGFTDYDQRFVEMAAIACGLLFSPKKLWAPLKDTEKQNLAAWLYGINEHLIPDCNWQFFMVLVNVALKRCGMRYSAPKLKEGLAKIESYYLGGGWYRDGASCQKDYYVSFAMHYYGLLYSVIMQEEDPERCDRFRRRAQQFAQDFIYWFSESGAALPFGRSLTYRFGEAAFWSAYLFAGVKGIPVPVIKGILVRHMDYWMRQNMFDRDGVLTLGYAYPNLIMAERYNAPGSPYWGMKTFFLLALPDSHPFWSAKAAPLPKLEAQKALPYADMLIQRRGGDVLAYTPGVCERYGHGHVPEKYAKFVYSTTFGFSVARSQIVLHENCPDSALAFVINGDDYVFTRKYCVSYQIKETCVVSTWSPFVGITVTSTVTPTATGHIRRHKIESIYDCTAYDCGFAVQKFCDGYAEQADQNSASVENAQVGCTVSGAGDGYLVSADPNTNVLYPNTTIPAVRYRVSKGNSALETIVTTVYKKK